MAKVAFLLGPAFEDSEMQKPYEAILEAGHEAVIIGLKAGEKLEGKQKKASYTVEMAIKDVNPNEFDAVVIPGGASPEALRLDPLIQSFVHVMDEVGKPIAAICHGPQILISAGLLQGRILTAYPPLQDDITNAGAAFQDKEVVVDRNLITSRTPKDEPAFIRETLKALEKVPSVRS
ncbi:type 1 glutamine amidotransferase domain-containing protein [Paenibacillus mucilaginosus]|uniref:PfpI family intracellular protease n=3 Tax=Paenibacillus mucilaginosus TaxID=61624 RepID=H6NRA0_9BACL|nr:type 1 glutamine amidotransferase domain-containing protein [Paenibacillus mucilaginosus]AEI45888.1 intracellular protease, PfpI family [Paenibacillus mucilaginosus KNP414]AFC33535.1 PfpI family intracellular protease [Paenibacillus mucilaginosus 3016]AFH65857.1 general stress protein [Paenibacillus mucilaginosus K02]MCG7217775.1 type 1 glutamine amidotransferase [Paenibacillus mucilaginosus]WDM27251.1 type 1 glutamine amidotransferase [Paenibacillus mucilaginosus]